MALSDIVNVVIKAQQPGVTRQGFGVPLILSQNAAWIERTRVYTDLDGVLADFTATTPEYNAAKVLFSQNPKPPRIRIGRANTNPVTQRWAAAVSSILLGAAYKLWTSDATGALTRTVASYVLGTSAAWVALTAYVEGDIVTNDGGKFYVCSVAGTSAGAGGPTGTAAGEITDGSAKWFYAGASLAVAQNDSVIYGWRRALQGQQGAAWVASSRYLVGDIVTNDGGKFFQCFTAGVSAGAGGPTGTGTDITDGTVHWEYIGIVTPYLNATTISAQGTAGTKTLRVIVNTTAGWVALEVDDPSLAATSQDHAAPTGSGLATDLTAIANATTDWYGLITFYNSSAYVAAAAAKIETLTKLYVVATSDTASATTSDSTATDVLHNLKASSYARSAGFFHPRAAEFVDAGEMGRFFPIDPGGDNWRLKTLAGVTSGWGNGQQYTATQTTNLTDRHANYYYDLAGVDVIGGDGKVADNEYIDVIRFLDWWTARVGERLANLLIQNEKIPYTDAGIQLIATEVRAQNREGIDAGGINPGSPPGIPAPTVTVPKAGAVPSADRKARTLNNVNTSWTLAGAINKITVNASVST